ncbi:hypothetical protein B7463_g4265, partial [Scytalidium lignicola]
MAANVSSRTIAEAIVDGSTSPSGSYSPFLSLPFELRNLIYDNALSYPSFKKDYQKILNDTTLIDSSGKGWRHLSRPALFTPTILLLNHQITSEAINILHANPLIIDATPPGNLGDNLKWIEITDFISYRTLQAVPSVILVMDLNFQPRSSTIIDNALAWSRTVEILLDIWSFRNRLQKLIVKVDYIPPSKRAGWTFAQAGHHQCVVGLLSKLAKFSSEVPVTFEGNLEVDPWKVSGFHNPHQQQASSAPRSILTNFMNLQAPTGSGVSKIMDDH